VRYNFCSAFLYKDGSEQNESLERYIDDYNWLNILGSNRANDGVDASSYKNDARIYAISSANYCRSHYFIVSLLEKNNKVCGRFGITKVG